MIRFAIVVLAMVTACWRTSAPPAATEDRATTPAVGPCPSEMNGFLQGSYWVNELFPGCPPAPFTVDGIVCDGACPMPCRETHRELGEEGDANPQGWQRTFTYVDGRLATVKGATNPESTFTKQWDDRCAYQAGRLVSCTTPQGPTRIERDAQGRITAVAGAESQEDLQVTYNADGRVATLVGRAGYLNATLQYDPAGRLVAEVDGNSTTSYAYDRDGRVQSVTLGLEQRTYDRSTGLLVERSALQSVDGRNLHRRSTTFHYDAQRRPVRVVVGFGETSALEYVYDYECGGR